MKVTPNKDLTSLNSFKVKAKARQLVEFNEAEELTAYLGNLDQQPNSFLILGGGSNTLFTKDYDGIVLKSADTKIEELSVSEKEITIRAGAACDWDNFVAHCTSRGWNGLENLTLIPGTVGAAPVQNIGAYGTEVSDLILSVQCVNLKTLEIETYSNEQCEFKYRDSVFKRRPYLLITSVNFRLNTESLWSARNRPVFYEIKKLPALLLSIPRVKLTPKIRLSANFDNVRDLLSISIIPPKIKRLAVKKMRQRTMPDPNKIGNAGCFFKSPIVSAEIANRIKSKHASVSIYKENNEQYKLSAGDLIKLAGWNGKTIGNVSINHNRPLILLNTGHASGQEIFDVATRIQNTIKNLVDIKVDFEVVIV
ncbi:UDP-N-acetylmuramate dehydrogenase [Pseudomonas abyssi]|uniref:UDP-N-acetylenolpyruvoylglucosamine reductase n=1 Tax=Pseudomonas abyssi TaxID=170540 RepID=A0A395R589_9PSED|nr:UDP-N-acetylmuramate dehydrogenase [Halopseudomonas gallaeciensis]RGP55270.1 hypothetical protein ASB58_09395 [Halopseudomonas gallaeciensis]